VPRKLATYCSAQVGMSAPLPNQRLLRLPCKFGDLYAFGYWDVFGYWDSFGDQELTMNVANFECPACPLVIGIEAVHWPTTGITACETHERNRSL